MVIECLNEGDVFVDVGAHFGYYSLLSSFIVGEAGEVHSFEPTPSVFKILKKNSINKNNITVNNFALSDKVSDKDFYDAGLNFSAFNGFNVPEFDQIDGSKTVIKKINVSCISLDSYFNDKKRQPSFVKIDAEDAEILVLKGMANIINKSHPIISLETGDHGHSDCSTKDKIKYLIDLNYTPYEYLNGKLIKHTIKEKYGYNNLLFLFNN